MQTVTETALITENGISIYADDIERLCAEYIDSLPTPENVLKTAGFTALLVYIYNNCLKRVIVRKYGERGNSYNFELLDSIFYKIYIPLCGKYGFTPTVKQFAVFTGIDSSNLGDIKSGVYRTDGAKVSPEKTHFVKKWYDASESALLNRAVDSNSIGSIFALKALYQYSDAQTIRVESASQEQHDSAEQIAQRHSAAELPEKPQLEAFEQ